MISIPEICEKCLPICHNTDQYKYEDGYWRRATPHWQSWYCSLHTTECDPECSSGNWVESIWAKWAHGG